MLYILPDTNALLHYRRPDQIDWKARIGASAVKIAISYVTVTEIDKHANTQQVRKLRDRARGHKAWIRSLIHPNGKPSGNVVADMRIPRGFLDGLDPSIPDNHLIASARMLNSEGHEVAILTDDTILQYKLEGLGIRGIWLEEEDRLSDEPDPLEAENAQLRRELNKIASRRPLLTLEWAGDEAAPEIRLQRPSLDDIATPDQIREKTKPLEAPPGTPDSLNAGIISSLSDLTGVNEDAIAIALYNTKLQSYYIEYEEYYDEVILYRANLACTFNLDFIGHNRGTAAANSFRARVTASDGITILESMKDLGDPPKPPQPPIKPDEFSFFPSNFGKGGSAAYSDIAQLGAYTGYEPDIENGSSFTFRLKRFDHHDSCSFDSVVALISPELQGGGAEFSIEIFCDEFAEPTKSKLALRVAPDQFD